MSKIKKIHLDKYVLFLFAFSLFFLIPIFNPNFYMSHDGEAHVARFAAYFNAFSDGQIPPRWAADLNSGYGTPLFIFFYPLPGYMASFLHIFGLDFENIFKLLVAGGFLLAPIFLYLWLKSFVRSVIAFAASLTYLAIPYRMLDTFVRGDVAELISFVFIPLIFLSIDKVLKEKNINYIILGGIFFGLFILSHNAIAFIFTPVFIAYALISVKDLKELSQLLLIFIIGLIVSAFFWLPSITEGKYVYSNLMVEKLYQSNFISFSKLIYSDWGFGPDINLAGGQSPQIGILYILIPFLSLAFFKKIKDKKKIIFWFLIFIISIFMTTNLSSLLWEKLPIIKLMGYPWRFIALSGFAASMIILYFLSLQKNKIILFSVALLFVLFSLPYGQVKGYIPKKQDSFYFSYQGTTDYHRRTSTIWTETDFWKKAQKQIEIIGGEGIVENLKRKSNAHLFSADAKTELKILDNTVYFPGWRVEVNGRKVPIEFQDPNHRGLITFDVPKGKNNIRVIFGESPSRLLSDIISLFGIISIGLILLFRRWVKRYLKI